MYLCMYVRVNFYLTRLLVCHSWYLLVFVPLLITLGLLFPVSQMISYICREKELRQKELLKMMSVTESDLGWSWFISYFVVYLVVATLCAAVSSQLYENSSVLLLWVFWVLTFIALVVFSMMISSFSAKTTRVRNMDDLEWNVSTVLLMLL